MMLGECSVEGFVWRSCFVGDRVDLVLRIDWTSIVPKPPRRLARWSLDIFFSFNPLVDGWMRGCNSTINGGLLLGSESVLESRYVWSAVTFSARNSPTNPHLLQGDLTVVLR